MTDLQKGVVVVGVGLTIGGAVAWWYRERWAGPSAAAPSTSAGGVTVTPKSSAVVMSPETAEVLAVVAAEAGWSGEVIATSGDRSGSSQAAAMLAKLERQEAGSEAKSDDLRWLYQSNGDIIEALLAMPRTVEAWGPAIEEWAANGRPLSSHLREGDALDIRLYDPATGERMWTEREVDDLLEVVGRYGGRGLEESDHVHLQGLLTVAKNIERAPVLT